MKEFNIEIQKRDEVGSSAMRRYRKAGLLPSVLYGRGQESVMALVPIREFTMLAQKAKRSQVWFFKSEDSELNGKTAIVKEVQRKFVSGELNHVDFQVLHEDEEIHIDVRIKITGEAPGVKLDGGILTFVTHELSVACLPRFIPTEVEVDISSLRIGDSIHARDLKLPEGVRLNCNPDETIVSVVTVRATRVDEAGAEGAAEGAAGAAAGAEGKAEEKKG